MTHAASFAASAPSDPVPPADGDLTVGEALRLALEHERAGRLSPAEMLAAAIVDAVPQHADALALLAALRLRRAGGEIGREEARTLLARAVANAGADAPFFANVGSLLRRAGAMGWALAVQRRALALDPVFAVAWFNLGNSLSDGSDAQPQPAERAYGHAARLLPNHPDPHRRQGDLLLSLGDPGAAAVCFTAAVRLTPEALPARLGLGDALRAQGQGNAALAVCRVALALQPDSAAALTLLGALLVDDGRPDAVVAGVAVLRRLAGLCPDDAVGRLALGEALTRLADGAERDSADSALRVALALRPADPRSLRVLGGECFAREDEAGTTRWHRRAVALARSAHGAGRVAALRVESSSRATGAAHRTIAPARAMAVDTGTTRWGEITYRLPETFLTRVEEGRVHPHHFTVETAAGALVVDGLHAYSRSNLTMLPHIVHHHPAAVDGLGERLLVDLPHAVQRVEEEAILLGGDGNFAHGVLDWASKLCVLERFPELAGLPVLVSAALRPAVVELFGLLGLSADRLIRVEPGAVLSCRRLWVPSLTHQFQYMAPEHLAFLRDRLGLSTESRGGVAGGGRRLFLSRAMAGHRGLVNEAEVAGLLAEAGFERYVPDGRSMAEQIAVFREAEAIVAPVGGGTAAVVFAPPGTRVIELTHERCVLPQYAILCALLKQPYQQIVGTAVRNRGVLAFDWDFRAPLDAVAAMLRPLNGSDAHR